MALSTKKGTLTFPVATGNFSVTGVGFQPEAVIFWLTDQTAAGYAADRWLGMGWGVSSTQRGALATFSKDGSTSDYSNQHIRSDRCFHLVERSSGSNILRLGADLVSMDVDGFTLNATEGDIDSQIVHYLALGGADLTGAWAGVIDTKSTTGTQAYTGVGFQPDCLLLLSNGQATAVPQSATGYRLDLGATDGTNQAALCVSETSSIPTDLRSVQKTGVVLNALNGDGSDKVIASLSSFDADGFTLNYTTVDGTRKVIALALAGGQFNVATETQKTSTGTKAKTGVGFTPTGLLLFGTNRASSASVDATLASLSIGASDGTNEGATWNGSTDNVSTTDENCATVTTKILRHATNPSTTDAEADLSSFDADGYTLDWTTADATAREFIGLAFGSEPSGTTVFGAASLTVTAGITTAGTRVKTGASASTFTLGIATAGAVSINGSSSLEITAGFVTAATRTRLASVSSTTTVGITTAGAAQFFGVASQTFTVGISVSGGLSTRGAASIGLNLAIDTRGIRGKSITLVPENESTITLDPKEPGVLP